MAKLHERTDPWPDLIMAMLSVNNYPLDKTFSIFEGLSTKGLFNPTNYRSWSPEEIAGRLIAAGYDRGPVMTELFVQRLASLKAICGDIASSERILIAGDQQEVAALVARVKGVGPRVLENYLLLRGDRRGPDK